MRKNIMADRRQALYVFSAGIAAAASGLLGCGRAPSAEAEPADQISVYSREDGSGTRSAFIELFSIEQKDSSGAKIDLTTTAAAITNSTSVMMTSIAGDAAGIGYISLGSLGDTVKAVEIDGAAATTENVKNGTYQVSRPFNVVLPQNLAVPAQDFLAYIMSAEGQAVVEENGYIEAAEAPASYAPTGASGKVVVAGSSSVTPVMEKLAEAYEALNPEVTIEIQQSDSTTGITMATQGTCDLGMASRDLKEDEKNTGVTATEIAKDGIAVIVSPDSAVDALTKDQVKAIFTGEITSWSQI